MADTKIKTMQLENLIAKAWTTNEGRHALWRIEAVAFHSLDSDHIGGIFVVYALTEDHETLPNYKDIELGVAGITLIGIKRLDFVGVGNAELNRENVKDSTLVFGLDLTTDTEYKVLDAFVNK